MPALKSQRRELFAQGVASGSTFTQAAESAGFAKKTAKSQGSRLHKDTAIQARIVDLRTQIATEAERTARAAIELASPVNIAAVRYVRQAIEDRQYRLTVLQEMLNELRAKTYSDEGRPIVNVYRETRECLKQAAIALGQWEEKQSQPVERPEYSKYDTMTVEELYSEQARLLGEKAKEKAKAEAEALRSGQAACGLIEAPAGSVEEIRNDGSWC